MNTKGLFLFKNILVMKKAKLMLSALAIIAVAGTALAFNAMKEFQFVYTGTSSTDCTHLVIGARIAPSGIPNIFASVFSTTSGCPFTSTITAVE